MVATLYSEYTPIEKEPLPTLWHWAFFPEYVRTTELNEDGHPKRGSLLPPVAMPNRIWACSHLTINQPIYVGESVVCEFTIENIKLALF